MVRSRRSISKEDASSVLADSGISLSSPPANQKHFHLNEDEEEAILGKLCVTDDETEPEIIELSNVEKVVISDNDEDEADADAEAEAEAEVEEDFQDSEKCKVYNNSPPAAKRARKTYICDVCNKEFRGKSDLMRHKFVHTNEKPYKCETCGKSYRQEINLKNHITAAHKREKEFACTQCPKTFALKERLRLHMRLHTGEKPYACQQCDKRFARGGQLHQHMVTHQSYSVCLHSLLSSCSCSQSQRVDSAVAANLLIPARTHIPSLLKKFLIMPLTAENAALQIQDRLRDIQRLIHQIDDEHRRAETNINILNRANYSTFPAQKLKALYKTCLQDAVVEEDSIRRALDKIDEIRNIRNERRIQARNAGNKEAIRRGALMKMVQVSAQTLPLFVSKPGEKVPPLCGAIPAESHYIAKVGDNVAALVKGVEDEENWILAEVVQFLNRQNKYDVVDIDEEQKDRHVLSKRKVIPLPLMRANPETDGHALFPKDTVVMALYPQTTCFYKAIIHRLPQTATEDYEVLFEDSSYTNGYAEPLPVAQRYVIAYKPTKKIANNGGGGSGSVSSA